MNYRVELDSLCHGLIGLTSGRQPLRGRSHVMLRILELPFREGGDKVERTLHILAKSK